MTINEQNYPEFTAFYKALEEAELTIPEPIYSQLWEAASRAGTRILIERSTSDFLRNKIIEIVRNPSQIELFAL